MFTAFLHTIREAFQRRMSLVLLAVSLMAAGYYVMLFRFERAADGSVLVQTAVGLISLQEFLNFNLPGQLNHIGTFWLLLGALAAVPLLTSFHEKGWVELLVSKGVARWELLLGRYAAAFLQFAATLLLVCGVPAIHVWMGAGVSTWPFVKGAGLILIGYGATLALATLLAVIQPKVGLVSVLVFAQVFLSPLLTDRKDHFKEMPALEGVAGFFHSLLPRNDELRRMSIDIFYNQPVDSWTPLWATAIVLVVTLGAACVIFQRKSL